MNKKLDKIVSFAKDLKLQEFLLFIFTMRLVFNGASIGDAIALISLAGLYAYNHFLSDKNVKIEKSVQEQLDTLKGAIQSIKLNKGIITKAPSNENEELVKKRYF